MVSNKDAALAIGWVETPEGRWLTPDGRSLEELPDFNGDHNAAHEVIQHVGCCGRRARYGVLLLIYLFDRDKVFSRSTMGISDDDIHVISAASPEIKVRAAVEALRKR